MRGTGESVHSYRERILDDLDPLQPIELGLKDVLGLVLAEDIVAGEPIPSVPTAAIGGYAVASADIATASERSPVELKLRARSDGDVPALEPWTAVPLPGGTALPSGADVVIGEDAVRAGEGGIAVLASAAPGDGVRPEGRDLARGQEVARAGRRLRPGDIAVFAALGRTRIRCHPPPRTVLLAAGSELVEAEHSAPAGRVRDSNGPMLAALLRQAGMVTFSAGTVPDDRRRLVDAFDSNLGHADLFVVAGGGSGEVRKVLEMLGEVEATTVAMEPGAHQLYGRVRGAPVFGVPGHPASAFVVFETLVRPALRRLQGRRDLLRPRIRAVLDGSVETTGGVRSFLRVRLHRADDGWRASLAGGQDLHDLASLAAADGLAEIDEDHGRVAAGTEVDVHLLVET